MATLREGMMNLTGIGGPHLLVSRDLHSRYDAKLTTDYLCPRSTSGVRPLSFRGRSQSRKDILVSNGKGGFDVRSALSSNVEERVSFTQSVERHQCMESDVISVGRKSSSAIGSLPDDFSFQEGSSFPPESSSSDIARPQPIVQGYADSPFVGEFAIDITGTSGVVAGGSEFDAIAASVPIYRPKWIWFAKSAEEENVFIDRAINATIIGSAGTLALTKMLTVDHDYWHGWTLLEILQYAPVHNWFAYEELLKNHPVLAKMIISGTVYSLGDWIAQCYEGKGVLEFNRIRMLRSGLVGFCLHGSMSHFYYHFCEWLFPFQGWWVLPLKVGFDQTIWSGIWNSIYFVTIGLLRFESPVSIVKELRQTFFPLLTAGWKLWPFAHLVTYGLIPVEQRLLWVDMVEILWVTILAMYSNEKAEARIAEAQTAEVIKEAVIEAAVSEVGIDLVVQDEKKS